MKVRLSYVSNSSSASFVIHNFDKLPSNTQEAIKEYDKYAYAYCKEHHIQLEELPFTPNDRNVAEGRVLADWERRDGVGCINDRCRYHFRKDGDDLVAETSMDNFNFKHWLECLGVVDFTAEGENY